MADLLTIPDKRLRDISIDVEPGEDVSLIVEQMIDCLFRHEGIGLAAVQIGILKRIVVTEITERKELPKVYINPIILHRSLTLEPSMEGCLSIPGGNGAVTRPVDIVVQYRSLDGIDSVCQLDGIAARCMQHEVDHLDGVLFIDHLSRLKRERIVKKARRA